MRVQGASPIQPTTIRGLFHQSSFIFTFLYICQSLYCSILIWVVKIFLGLRLVELRQRPQPKFFVALWFTPNCVSKTKSFNMMRYFLGQQRVCCGTVPLKNPKNSHSIRIRKRYSEKSKMHEKNDVTVDLSFL